MHRRGRVSSLWNIRAPEVHLNGRFGYFAGKLIDDAGLRGFSYGGAQVSEKHCGFVINKDHATAKDIVTLMKEVNRIVTKKFGVSLEPEVKMIGEFE